MHFLQSSSANRFSRLGPKKKFSERAWQEGRRRLPEARRRGRKPGEIPIAAKCRELRADLTQLDLKGKAGISVETIRRIESGHRVDRGSVIRLAEAFTEIHSREISADELLTPKTEISRSRAGTLVRVV